MLSIAFCVVSGMRHGSVMSHGRSQHLEMNIAFLNKISKPVYHYITL